jgi:TPR repeat protein
MFNLLTAMLAMLLLYPQAPGNISALKARAQGGDTKAQVQLGIAYASGNGVAADEAEAVQWFRKAAEKGDAAGEYSLSEMYLSGRGVPVDVPEGLKWLRRSAEHGDARGQSNLAAVYSQGLGGVTKDEKEAAKWMRKAAEQGLAEGQFGLGLMYVRGSGVPQDAAEAVRWYRKAIDQGDSRAMNNLAYLLAISNDAKIRNPKEAITFAQKAVAAEPDSATCLDTLATAYFQDDQPGKAADAERRALTLKPDDPSYKASLDKYLSAVKQ